MIMAFGDVMHAQADRTGEAAPRAARPAIDGHLHRILAESAQHPRAIGKMSPGEVAVEHHQHEMVGEPVDQAGVAQPEAADAHPGGRMNDDMRLDIGQGVAVDLRAGHLDSPGAAIAVATAICRAIHCDSAAGSRHASDGSA